MTGARSDAGTDANVDVIVVGAGLSGLTATTELVRGGWTVRCLEARSRVGGRALSVHGWVDLGATWFWNGEPTVDALLRDLGIARYDQPSAGDAVVQQADGSPMRVHGNPLDPPAYRIAGGVQRLARTLADRLPPGTVELATAVEAVQFTPDGAVTVHAGGRRYRAQAVVLAIPPALVVESITFTPALPPALSRIAASVPTWMGDTVKAVARFDTAFWREHGLAGSAISYAGPFGEFHDHAGPEGQPALFGFAPAAAFATASQHEVAAAFAAQLRSIWSGPPPIGLDVMDWRREAFTSPERPPPRSGLAYYGHPSLRASYADGRLLLCSTETAEAHAGHLEGALVAGRQAARAVGQRLDVAVRSS